ncbi:hypothetical protein FM113_10760 [Leucobacter sp. 7(1)]|nr:hypothetical protein FM113_10760 [Leucobacter sp. 7(1)]
MIYGIGKQGAALEIRQEYGIEELADNIRFDSIVNRHAD